MSSIRVRFAPSPTGFVHVGSLRTALYNYLFAKHHKGIFILRIEDTDQARYTKGAVENLLDTLNWSGLPYDEGPGKETKYGPYYQSQRTEIYKKYAEELIRDGNAYPCFCTADRLEQMRQDQIKLKMTPKYDGHCRQIPSAEAENRRKDKEYVIRLKIPEEGITSVPDLIRGKVDFQNDIIDDQIRRQSAGFPTYHLANVVEEHLMEISHVIRGEEWLISTPKHLLLYQYLGWDPPEFAHLPLLLNPNRSKLSKRQGDVAVEDYRNKGFLPEALVNFVALLGWNRGDDQEIFSLDELVADFSLERVSKSGAVFNQEKLKWMNGLYIREMPEEKYLECAREEMKKMGTDSGDNKKNNQIALAVRKSLETFGDLKEKARLFINVGDLDYGEDALPWIQPETSKQVFRALKKEIESVSAITLDNFKQIMGRVQTDTGIKGKDLWMPVRVSLTGLTEGPELPVVIEVLGKDRILKCLDQAINT